MKHLIYKDSSTELSLNISIKTALGQANAIIDQYKKTSLKPITSKTSIENLFNDPVKFISEQLQESTNLSTWKINPSKLVDLLDDPEINKLINMLRNIDKRNNHLLMENSKFTKSGFEIDQNLWHKYVEKMTCTYTESPTEEKVYNSLNKLIEAIKELSEHNVDLAYLLMRPLGNTILKFNPGVNSVEIQKGAIKRITNN